VSSSHRPPVTDDEVLTAVRETEGRAVNGLSDTKQVAEHIGAARSTVSDHFRRLEAEGKLAVHESLVIGTGHSKDVTTAEVLES